MERRKQPLPKQSRSSQKELNPLFNINNEVEADLVEDDDSQFIFLYKGGGFKEIECITFSKN
jgi:hypothetical protein